ncbi:MAG: methylthioribulose 1-phosphate dehydratase [Candidatus Melainabacteria bacterium]|nr:methylthioribulose 1-phosphate dehydratase [Candidatus Melainabacteria bacterium]MBI3309125.1 methylthioribulose 1-phosphate dehydratase [Candidatus Melainabacteria bacterium]
MLGTAGNLSIRISELKAQSSEFKFLITASGRDKGELTEDDFLIVDGNGCHCEDSDSARNDIKPSAETLLHAAIYKHTNANAVFHVHTTNNTLISALSPQLSALSFNGLEILKALGFKTHDVKITIPVIDNSQDMKHLAKTAPSLINESIPGLLLKGHGLYAWGNNPSEAKRHVETFEFLFEYRLKELSLKTKS